MQFRFPKLKSVRLPYIDSDTNITGHQYRAVKAFCVPQDALIYSLDISGLLNWALNWALAQLRNEFLGNEFLEEILHALCNKNLSQIAASFKRSDVHRVLCTSSPLLLTVLVLLTVLRSNSIFRKKHPIIGLHCRG